MVLVTFFANFFLSQRYCFCFFFRLRGSNGQLIAPSSGFMTLMSTNVTLLSKNHDLSCLDNLGHPILAINLPNTPVSQTGVTLSCPNIDPFTINFSLHAGLHYLFFSGYYGHSLLLMTCMAENTSIQL